MTMYSRLLPDNAPGPSSRYSRASSPAGPKMPTTRNRQRADSNASTASSLSIVSPRSSSTTSLPPSRSPSPSRSVSPFTDDTVSTGPEYVLAMHDYEDHPNSTCLAFRAGQVIRVFNRDPSGWWDGELEGRRGWFPSNYVTTDIDQDSPTHSRSSSWESVQAPPTETEPYTPPLMDPLLHGLTLLQNAVRGGRRTHFQPSTACIISCVRSILEATGTLRRDDPILLRNPPLAEERRRILTVLASLVTQAKKASDESQPIQETTAMIRLAGQVFAHVRRFLTVAAQCGVELPDALDTPLLGLETPSGKTPTQRRILSSQPTLPPIPLTRTRSGGSPRGRTRSPTAYPNGSLTAIVVGDNAMRIQQENAVAFRRGHRVNPSVSSSVSSMSSFSSQGSSSPPPFPSGPSTAVQVLEALRNTHDQYLSTIAAFIGHAHSHSQTSHASSTGQLYDLVKEIVELVCKLLTIVEAVMHHPDVPLMRINSLKHAKEGLFKVTSSLAESVRLLTTSRRSSLSEDEEKKSLLQSATGALKVGADCVASVKVCLTRSIGNRPFMVELPNPEDFVRPFSPNVGAGPSTPHHNRSGSSSYHLIGMEDEDLTIQAITPSPVARHVLHANPHRERHASSSSESSTFSAGSWRNSFETHDTMATSIMEEPNGQPRPHPLPAPPHVAPVRMLPQTPVTVEPPAGESPITVARPDEGRMREGPGRGRLPLPPPPTTMRPSLEQPREALPELPEEETPEELLQEVDPMAWRFTHDYPPEDVAYNNDGHLVGATMAALVEKMTPHDSLVDPAFSAVFFLTFRLFSSPLDLVDTIISRYNLTPPAGMSPADEALWGQQKGIPVRLRVSNFIKTWVDTYWRPGVDDPALTPLTMFTREGLALIFPGPAQRILDLLNQRRQAGADAVASTISPKGDTRARDPGMVINPPNALNINANNGEVPRPTMTKTLLMALRKRDFAGISVMDFDALELARQLTIMECQLYCEIQPHEVLETGQEGARVPIGVRAVTSLSTVITGWVAESILEEADLKRRTALVKFFVKLADRCAGLSNFSTSRSILAALDSSTISRLRQTWAGLPQKCNIQMEALRKLADHSRNYHEYRSRLRNSSPPAVPFLGLYLTDVTFCREGNPSFRPSPLKPAKKLINFNKYHKLARIVQDMQRFQVCYNLRAIPEVQLYLGEAFERAKKHGDLQDLYRRSLLVEPKQAAEPAPASDMNRLFHWATRSNNPQYASSTSS